MVGRAQMSVSLLMMISRLHRWSACLSSGCVSHLCARRSRTVCVVPWLRVCSRKGEARWGDTPTPRAEEKFLVGQGFSFFWLIQLNQYDVE